MDLWMDLSRTVETEPESFQETKRTGKIYFGFSHILLTTEQVKVTTSNSWYLLGLLLQISTGKYEH